MEGLNILDLFQTGGIVLVFIGFQAWLIRYFMSQLERETSERKALIDKFDIALNNHCMKVTSALVEQRHTFEMLCAKIEELVDALNHKE